jgi:hypothetical protein
VPGCDLYPSGIIIVLSDCFIFCTIVLSLLPHFVLRWIGLLDSSGPYFPIFDITSSRAAVFVRMRHINNTPFSLFHTEPGRPGRSFPGPTRPERIAWFSKIPISSFPPPFSRPVRRIPRPPCRAGHAASPVR